MRLWNKVQLYYTEIVILIKSYVHYVKALKQAKDHFCGNVLSVMGLVRAINGAWVTLVLNDN